MLARQRSIEPSRHAVDRFAVFRVRVNRRGDWVLLRTRASGGLTGLADCSHSGDDLKVLASLEQYQRQLRGRSTFAVEELRQWSRAQAAEHGRPAMVALSAVEGRPENSMTLPGPCALQHTLLVYPMLSLGQESLHA